MRKFGLNILEEGFLTKLQELRRLAQKARRIEMESVGVNHMASIDMYKEVVRAGYVLIGKIDENKMRDLKTIKSVKL